MTPPFSGRDCALLGISLGKPSLWLTSEGVPLTAKYFIVTASGPSAKSGTYRNSQPYVQYAGIAKRSKGRRLALHVTSRPLALWVGLEVWLDVRCV